ncbi:MAG: MarR family transcriptional regulator [Candidatus Dadabacteria bacterium]|nr:MarR family transcriptional regulator [Candidatus Dadabacteria bacterium]NIQ13718.1 MarR family transcriptional regulator [Candidatus Dadabacteria bacterium]
MKLKSVIDQIERIGNLIRSEEKKLISGQRLQPVHVQVLKYLSICNKYSNTPMAVSSYIGNTKGTTSQTLIVLEENGYINKEQNKRDKRGVNLFLTVKGKKLLNKLSKIYIKQDLSLTGIEETEKFLDSFLKYLQKSNSFRTFGACRTCRYFLTEDTGFRCGLTKEILKPDETSLICYEHEDEIKINLVN